MKNIFQKVSIIGNGNVGFHLIEAFCDAGIEVTHVLVRHSINETERNVAYVNSYSELPKNQLVIVCVPDDFITEVIEQIDESCPVAYTSGSVNIASLPKRNELGVFYPLQSFSKGVQLEMGEVPFFIEANEISFGESLFELAQKLSKNVKYASSEQRSKLHLAAVWVNNFTNHLTFIAQEYLESEQMDFEDLKPLLKETIRKIELNSPRESQTGPARRGDQKTIEKHLKMLNESQQEIYRILTQSIQKTYLQND